MVKSVGAKIACPLNLQTLVGGPAVFFISRFSRDVFFRRTQKYGKRSI